MTPTSRSVAAPERLVTRRRFLAGAGAATLGSVVLPSVLPRYAFATPNDPLSGDVLVVVFLRGGADGLSLVPPFSDAGYQTLRGAGTGNDVAVPPPNGADPGNTAIDLGVTVNGHSFGLHPALAGLKGVWDAGHLAVVHAVGMPASESQTRSHFASEANWERGSGDLTVQGGWLARHLAAAGVSDTLAAVAHDSSLPASLRGDHRAVAVPSIADFDVDGFWDAAPSRAALERIYPGGTIDPLVQQGADTLAAVDLMTAADPGQFDTNGSLYPANGPARQFARGLREIAQLIRADIGLRVAAVDYNGWDFHDAMGPVTGGTMRSKAQGLSDALTAFHTDLGEHLGEVTLVTMSEFGRTIGVNGSGGTDHGRGGAMFVMSGHAVPGVHGDYPAGPLTDGPEDDLAVTTDYRAVLTELLTKRVGTGSLADVFPGYVHGGDLGVVSA